MTDPLADPFDLPPVWDRAMHRIIKMMQTGVVAADDLPLGPASNLGIERYAREVVAANPQSDLGIMYALLSVATCVAGQGAFMLKAPIAGGGWLDVPDIQQAVCIAASGWRKSTALNVATAPLHRALGLGEAGRRKRIPELRTWAEKQVEAQLPVGKEIPKAQFTEVFSGGYCTVTVVKDPTVEGLRNMLVQNGGCAAVMAGEADVFHNLRQYNPDGASLTFFLDGWSQESVSTVRAGQGMLAMEEAALFIAVLFQSDVFAEVTSGGARGMAGGADSFQQRGMFGRMWVVEAQNNDGWAAAAVQYADNTVLDSHHGSNGMSNKWGELSPLGAALQDYTANLEKMVAESNEYRLLKALRHSWLQAFTKYGNDFLVPEPDVLERTAIEWGEGATLAYFRLQRMFNAVMETLSDMDPDIQAMWEPLASRLVQHVLREALTVTLAAGERVVTGEIIEDCATRVIPWRWGLTTKALMRRQTERVDEVIALSMMENTQETDLGVDAKVRRVLEKMSEREPSQRGQGWARSEIIRRVTSTISSRSRAGVGPRIGAALDALAETPGSGVMRAQSGTDAVNRPTYRYMLVKYAAAATEGS